MSKTFYVPAHDQQSAERYVYAMHDRPPVWWRSPSAAAEEATRIQETTDRKIDIYRVERFFDGDILTEAYAPAPWDVWEDDFVGERVFWFAVAFVLVFVAVLIGRALS